MGAQAGAAGANVGLAGMAADRKNRDNTNTLLYNDARERIASKEGEIKGIRDSISDRAERNDELEALYGKDGLRRSDTTKQFEDPLITSGLAKVAQKQQPNPEEMSAISSSPSALSMYDRLTRASTYEGQYEFQKEKIFQYALNNMLEMIFDTYNNYIIQKIFENRRKNILT